MILHHNRQYLLNVNIFFQFCTCLVLIFILELSGGIAGYLAKDRAAEMLNTTFDITMKNYNTSNATRDLWDDTQKNVSVEFFFVICYVIYFKR